MFDNLANDFNKRNRHLRKRKTVVSVVFNYRIIVTDIAFVV